MTTGWKIPGIHNWYFFPEIDRQFHIAEIHSFLTSFQLISSSYHPKQTRSQTQLLTSTQYSKSLIESFILLNWTITMNVRNTGITNQVDRPRRAFQVSYERGVSFAFVLPSPKCNLLTEMNESIHRSIQLHCVWPFTVFNNNIHAHTNWSLLIFLIRINFDRM